MIIIPFPIPERFTVTDVVILIAAISFCLKLSINQFTAVIVGEVSYRYGCLNIPIILMLSGPHQFIILITITSNRTSIPGIFILNSAH